MRVAVGRQDLAPHVVFDERERAAARGVVGVQDLWGGEARAPGFGACVWMRRTGRLPNGVSSFRSAPSSLSRMYARRGCSSANI